MPKVVVLYPRPVDPASFDSAYREEHVPLVRAQMPEARLVASRVIGRDAPYHLMAELHFESMEALKRTLASAGGERAAGHARQLSTGGAPVTFVVDDPTP